MDIDYPFYNFQVVIFIIVRTLRIVGHIEFAA